MSNYAFVSLYLVLKGNLKLLSHAMQIIGFLILSYIDDLFGLHKISGLERSSGKLQWLLGFVFLKMDFQDFQGLQG